MEFSKSRNSLKVYVNFFVLFHGNKVYSVHQLFRRIYILRAIVTLFRRQCLIWIIRSTETRPCFLQSPLCLDWCFISSNSLRPCELYVTGFLCPWNSPGKNTGVSCQSLLQGIFPTQGLNLESPILQADSLPAEPQGKPKNTGVGSLPDPGIKPGSPALLSYSS